MTSPKCAECDKLRRIIAKEVSENDELGSEFVYVNALREQLTEARSRIPLLEQALIKTPEQLSAVTRTVERWGFGTPDARIGNLESQLQASQAQVALAIEALEEINELPCCPNTKYPGCHICDAVDIISHRGLTQLRAGEKG